jgi:hypothetical protein
LASSTQNIKFPVASLLLYSKVLQATSVLSILTWHMCMHSCWLWHKKQHCNWGEDLIVCERVTWEVWCCDLPSLTCSSVKGMSICLSVYPICTWHDDSQHPAANVQQTSSCSWNPQQMKKQIMTLRKQKHKKLQKLWRNSSDPLSFVGYFYRGEERERERAREREREKRRKRERRGGNKRSRCKKTTQTARGEQVNSHSHRAVDRDRGSLKTYVQCEAVLFLGAILCYSQSGDDTKEDLASFC